MATNVDKALYSQVPMVGLAEVQDVEPIEIEIEDPESVNISGPGFEIEIEPGEPDDFDANLAEYLDDTELQKIANE